MHRKPSPQATGTAQRVGRSRDSAIDARILAAARRQLSVLGYEAMSVASVAQEAGTTRQALYRRWPTKAELADAAVAALEDVAEPGRALAGAGGLRKPAGHPRSAAGDEADEADDPLKALVAELEDFQRAITRPGRLSLVGTMLQETTDAEVLARYRAKVIAPRRRRIRAMLERAAELGLIDADADFAVAVTLATGSWYGHELAGDPPPADWPRRTAELVWRAVGGQVPPSASQSGPDGLTNAS